MRQAALILSAFVLTASMHPQPVKSEAAKTKVAFSPFTGKITKNRVRLRSKPDLDSAVIRELNNGEMVAIVAEEDDFYAVKPSKEAKAYVFRTYILDNTVEGNHVNVRLEPDLQAPVIAQLNHGDKVKGSICGINNKWLEINPPESVVFYVSKDYVSNIGDANMLQTIERRRKEASDLVDKAYVSCQAELKKEYQEVDLEQPLCDLNRVVKEYGDFPDQAKRATYYLTQVREVYLQKKIDYLEDQSAAKASAFKNRCQELSMRMHDEQEKIHSLEKNLNAAMKGEEVQFVETAQRSETVIPENRTNVSEPQTPSIALAPSTNQWYPKETIYFENWQAKHPGANMDDFYRDEYQQSTSLRGIVQPYHRNVKNKPGNYLLLDPVDRMPIAFLYSTRVDLQHQVGKTITLVGSSRPNNHFAFPAYFVLGYE